MNRQSIRRVRPYYRSMRLITQYHATVARLRGDVPAGWLLIIEVGRGVEANRVSTRTSIARLVRHIRASRRQGHGESE